MGGTGFRLEPDCQEGQRAGPGQQGKPQRSAVRADAPEPGRHWPPRPIAMLRAAPTATALATLPPRTRYARVLQGLCPNCRPNGAWLRSAPPGTTHVSRGAYDRAGPRLSLRARLPVAREAVELDATRSSAQLMPLNRRN